MKRFIIAVLLVQISLACRAWDVSGHMIVAQIAYDRLNDHAKQHLKDLAGQLELNNKPLNEVNIAAWADEIKHQHGGTYGGHFKNWHFVDVGCNPDDPNPLDKPPALTIQNGDLVTALNHCVAVLKDHASDPLIPNDSVAIALIVHLVGDIHQPLHCTTHYYAQAKVEPGHKRETSDAGGNAVTLSNFQNQYPELHQFWDVAYKTDFKDGQITAGKDLSVANITPGCADVADWATRIKAFAPASTVSLTADFHAWAVETHGIGCASGYDALHSDPEAVPKALEADYANAAKEIASQRLCLAAYRLAELLNQIYP